VGAQNSQRQATLNAQRAVQQRAAGQRAGVTPPGQASRQGVQREIEPSASQNNIRPGSLATPIPLDQRKLSESLDLDNMDIDKLKVLMSKRSWVVRVVDCIVHVGYCNLRIAYQLHQRIAEAPTIQGDLFAEYDRGQKLNAINAILTAVGIMQKYYPDQWERVEQKLEFLDRSLSTRR